MCEVFGEMLYQIKLKDDAGSGLRDWDRLTSQNFGKSGMKPVAAVILMAPLFGCITPIKKSQVHECVGSVWKNKASASTVAAEQSVLCPTSYQGEVLMYQTDLQSLKQEFFSLEK